MLCVEYSSDPMTLKNGSMSEVVKREWKFIDTDAATAHFVGLLRHASVVEATLTGPLPTQLLQVRASLGTNRKERTSFSRHNKGKRKGLSKGDLWFSDPYARI